MKGLDQWPPLYAVNLMSSTCAQITHISTQEDGDTLRLSDMGSSCSRMDMSCLLQGFTSLGTIYDMSIFVVSIRGFLTVPFATTLRSVCSTAPAVLLNFVHKRLSIVSVGVG